MKLKSYPHWANFGESCRILAKTVQWGWGESWRILANIGEFWRKVFWQAKKDSPKFAKIRQEHEFNVNPNVCLIHIN